MASQLSPEEQEKEEQRIEEEIAAINRTIDSWEDTDPYYMHDQVRKLRHRVMYVHTRCESSVGTLLGRYVFAPANGTIEKTTRQIMFTRFDFVVSEADFARKVTLAHELNLIDGKLKSKLMAVNSLRIIFSHPKSHEAKNKEFLDRPTYLDALKKLKAALDALNEVFTKIIEETEKEKSKE